MIQKTDPSDAINLESARTMGQGSPLRQPHAALRNFKCPPFAPFVPQPYSVPLCVSGLVECIPSLLNASPHGKYQNR